jgi:hypothetical protein
MRYLCSGVRQRVTWVRQWMGGLIRARPGGAANHADTAQTAGATGASTNTAVSATQVARSITVRRRLRLRSKHTETSATQEPAETNGNMSDTQFQSLPGNNVNRDKASNTTALPATTTTTPTKRLGFFRARSPSVPVEKKATPAPTTANASASVAPSVSSSIGGAPLSRGDASVLPNNTSGTIPSATATTVNTTSPGNIVPADTTQPAPQTKWRLRFGRHQHHTQQTSTLVQVIETTTSVTSAQSSSMVSVHSMPSVPEVSVLSSTPTSPINIPASTTTNVTLATANGHTSSPLTTQPLISGYHFDIDNGLSLDEKHRQHEQSNKESSSGVAGLVGRVRASSLATSIAGSHSSTSNTGMARSLPSRPTTPAIC